MAQNTGVRRIGLGQQTRSAALRGYGAAVSVGIFVILAIVIIIYVKTIRVEQT